jgi:hypothetical protein
MGRRRRNVLGATVVVLVLATAGCGGGGVDEADATATTVEPSTTSEPSSPPTTLTDEQAVLAAYQGYWDTWLVANDPPNPDHPDLGRYATGAALAKVRESIANHRSVGQVLRLPVNSISEHRSRVVALDGRTAVLSDCSIDDGLVLAYGSGTVLNDAVGTWLIRATLEWSGGAWLVKEVAVEGTWEGVAGCAA